MATTLSSKERIARKEHRCSFCGCIIHKGEHYFNYAMLYDGFYEWKTHLECEEIASELNMYSDCDNDVGVTSDDWKERVSDEFNDRFYDEGIDDIRKDMQPIYDNYYEMAKAILEDIKNKNKKKCE